MKIRVQRREGNIEIISVVGPLVVTEGGILSYFNSAEGMDHYFTPDGYYDGWGMACNIPSTKENKPPVTATELIDRIEKDREIEP